MHQIERKTVDSIVKHQGILYFMIITFIAMYVRYTFRGFISGDMKGCLLPWYEKIHAAGGFPAMAGQVGDYNIIYQFIICLFTYLPAENYLFTPLYLYKYLSILFDFLLAGMAGLIVIQIKTKDKIFWFNLTYSIAIMFPTIVLNSSMWGQCDSIFTFFLIASLYFLLKEKDILAFAMYGCALMFKLQAIFLLPLYFFSYFYFRRFSIILFCIPFFILWLSGIPAYLYGRSLLTPFQLYLHQTDEYHRLFLNVTSFWLLMQEANYDIFVNYAVLLTLAIFGIGLYTILSGYIKLDSPEQILSVACWCLWTCVLFLPAMHERYTYPRDVLLILLALLNTKNIKFALPETFFSFITYGNYFFASGGVNVWCSLISVGLYLWYSMDLLGIRKSNDIICC